MRLTNGSGAVMHASGAVAEFYQGQGWVADSAPEARSKSADEQPAKRPGRRRKANDGVDTDG